MSPHDALAAEVSDARIDRAVWSFWSLPFASYAHGRWASERFHHLSWLLSVLTVRRRFAVTSLVTDEDGAQLLVNELQLPFDHVSTSLERLRNGEQRWWILGKLVAYREQEVAFLHFDSDVYLWKALPAPMLTADLVAQNPEYAPNSDVTFYKPTRFTDGVKQNGGRLPPEWHAYVEGGAATGICTGIFGGVDVSVIRRYAERAIWTIQREENLPVWQAIHVGMAENVLMEQYYLAAFWADMASGRDRRARREYAFASRAEALGPSASRRVGYTHLMAAKHSHALERMVTRRLQAEFPAEYERLRAGERHWAVGTA